MARVPSFRRGDLVEVKGAAEILATLDADGKLDGLLFMPEMARYCGQRLRVFRRATKTCIEGLGLRRMEGAVLLEGLRCDGSAHEGCQRACLLFWKEAWLKPCADAPAAATGDPSEPRTAEEGTVPSPVRCLAALPTTKGDRFYCQSTELPGATHEFPGGNLRHFFRDFLAGDVTLAELGRILRHKVVNRMRRHFGREERDGRGNIGRRLTVLFDRPSCIAVKFPLRRLPRVVALGETPWPRPACQGGARDVQHAESGDA